MQALRRHHRGRRRPRGPRDRLRGRLAAGRERRRREHAPSRRVTAGGVVAEARAGVRPARLRDGAPRRLLPPLRRREDRPHQDREERRPAPPAVPRHLRPGLTRRRAGPALDGLRPALRAATGASTSTSRTRTATRASSGTACPRPTRTGRRPPRPASSSASASPTTTTTAGSCSSGPDGRLYVGMGDGGSGGDPQGHAQDPRSRLGKLLRINVNASPVRVGIYAKGLRNPWRFSFDRRTGALWIGDVGQNAWEEIDYLRPGRPRRRQLRLERLRGHARLQRGDRRRAEEVVAHVAGLAVRPQRRVLGDRGLRVPGRRDPVAARLLRLRRLLRTRLGQARTRREPLRAARGETVG